MAFFPQERRPPANVLPSDRLYARTLCAALVERALVGHRSRMSVWARQFSLLRKDGYGICQIEETLLWYTSQVGRPFIPQAFCAKSFRLKYPAILAAYGRWKTENTQTPITEAARIAATRLGRRGWPKGSKGQLPEVCQQSLDNLTDFANRLNGMRLPAEMSAGDRNLLARFIMHVRPKLAGAAFAVEQHLQTVNAALQGWDAWSGNLRAFVWHPDNKTVGRTGREWANRYAHRPELWDMLVATVSGVAYTPTQMAGAGRGRDGGPGAGKSRSGPP